MPGPDGHRLRGVPGILFVYSRPSSFISIDLGVLRERYEVRERAEPRPLVNVFAVARDVWRSDLVFGWFAHWHSFWPITIAWLLRKPSVLVIGGFDTANMPEVGYGLQRGGLRRAISRWTMRRASRLITNSNYSREEIERNTGIPARRVTVVHHGMADPFGRLPDEPRERMALTVGIVDRANLARKGLLAFVRAAALLPDVRFVVAGRWDGDAVEQLRREAGDNVELTGWIEQPDLERLYRRAAVYVQASAHEGFGMSVAEAMLAGDIPVVTRAGALPEVVGEYGIMVDEASAEAIAAGTERALTLGEEARARARQHVLGEFPLEMRRDGIQRVVAEALG
jgi:glycosyltransferase involved in cell wall biosynthesis